MAADSAPTSLRAAEPAQSLFDFKKIFRRALKFWYLYVLSLLICVGYAWFKVHYATPMYKVYAQVMVQDNKSSGGAQALSGNGMDFSALFGSKINLQNEIAILQTKDICRKVVDAQQLYISYYDQGDIRAVELYDGCPFQILYSADNDTIRPLTMHITFDGTGLNVIKIGIGKKTIPWHFFDTLHYNQGSYYFVKKVPQLNPKAKYMVMIQNPDAAAGNISGNLGAGLLGTRSSILSLSYNTNIPRKGENVLGGIIQAYANRTLDNKNDVSDSTIQFINRRIALVGNDLTSIENTIQTFKEQNKIANLNTQSGLLISNGNTYFQQLNQLEVQLQVMATMLSYIQDDTNNSRPIPALLNGDATFGGLVSSYNTAQVQRDKILLTLKNDNPIVANLNMQIAGLRSDMIKSLQSQQKALTISKNDLVRQNERVNSLIEKIPSQERQFLDYSREQDLRQNLFLFLLQKREEIAIAKASNASNASIISAPRASGVPYQPVSTTAYTVSILLGLLLPTTFIVVSLLLNNKITSREDITGATPATLLSEIGHAKKEGLIDLAEEGRSMMAEQFRIFRTNMDFALSGAKNPVILVTSTMSGEGKSFIAANLGQIYAISGKRVLLMELDLRKPKLSQSLGVANERGFSNYIVSDSPVGSFIQQVPTVPDNLFILPAGPVPPNPAELLLSDKTTGMMEELKKLFDIIIIDTAPIGAVTDAQILSAYATVSLYILRQNYTTKNSFSIINDLLLNNKIQPLYLIMNDIAGGSSYRYGYGYGYGYGYKSYGYGYYDNEKREHKWWQRKK